MSNSITVKGNIVTIIMTLDPKAGGKMSATGKTLNFGYAREVVKVAGEDITVSVQAYVPLKAAKPKASEAPKLSIAEARKLANG